MHIDDYVFEQISCVHAFAMTTSSRPDSTGSLTALYQEKIDKKYRCLLGIMTRASVPRSSPGVCVVIGTALAARYTCTCLIA